MAKAKALPFRTVPIPQLERPITRYQLAEQVATMRRLQAEYFRSRSTDVLRSCKKLEAEVDQACAKILAQGAGSTEASQANAIDDDVA